MIRFIVCVSLVFGSTLCDAATRYVSPTGGNIAPYTWWATAARRIQDAVAASSASDTVLVAGGTYAITNEILIEKKITLLASGGGTPAIIDGCYTTRCVKMTAPGAVLDGFTIQNGRVTDSNAFGGGVYCEWGDVRNCAFRGNTANPYGKEFYVDYTEGKGGGVYCVGSRIHACSFTTNGAISHGGGIWCEDSTVSACWIEANQAFGYVGDGDESGWPIGRGGGVWMSGSTMDQSVVSFNTASAAGGGLFVTNSEIRNSIVFRNKADGDEWVHWSRSVQRGRGGGVYGDGVIQNCTIVQNFASALDVGNGVDLHPGFIRNSIVEDNSIAFGWVGRNYYGECTFEYSLTSPNPGGVGNTTNNPMFNADYSLMAGSPCIDAGTELGASKTDFSGFERVDDPAHANVRSIVDMGAHEYISGIPYREPGCWSIQPLGAKPWLAAGLPWGGAPGWDPVPGDYNGDGTNDLAIYQQLPAGMWFIRTLVDGAPAITFAFPWGGANLVPVPGEFNGDGVADLAVYEQTTGNWYIRALGPGNPITFGQNWGGPGLTPVPGDYNGDGLSDLAVYQESTGNWYIRPLGPGNPITFGQNWGGGGLTAVPGDYNKDGVCDLAAYQESTGNWYIRSLGRGKPITFGQNWGGPGLVPACGDYNGDRMSDLSVFHPASGSWFIRSLGKGNPICFGQVLGDANSLPVNGDFDGDGRDDLAIFQR